MKLFRKHIHLGCVLVTFIFFSSCKKKKKDIEPETNSKICLVADSKVLMLSAIDGTKIWEYDTENIINTSPIIAKNEVLIGTYNNSVISLDMETGEKKWEFPLENNVVYNPTYSNNILYVATGSRGLVGKGSILAINVINQETLWQYDTEYYAFHSLQFNSNRLFLGLNSRNLYCLDAKKGKELWSFRNNSSNEAFSYLEADSKNIYATSNTNGLYSFDASSGEINWYNNAINLINLNVEKEVLVGTNNKLGISCINTLDGELIWKTPDLMGSPRSSPFIHDDKIFYSNSSRTIALSLTDGSVLWYANTSGRADGVVVVNNSVYVPGDFSFYSLDMESGEYNWQVNEDRNYKFPVIISSRNIPYYIADVHHKQ